MATKKPKPIKKSVKDLVEIDLESLAELGIEFVPEQKEETKGPKESRPKAIKVFGRKYRINYIPEYAGMTDMGHCDNTLLLINTKEHQLPIEETDTILHEVIHAIDFTVNTEMTEHQVRTIATGLLGVLQDNPEFAKYLIEKKQPEFDD